MYQRLLLRREPGKRNGDKASRKNASHSEPEFLQKRKVCRESFLRTQKPVQDEVLGRLILVRIFRKNCFLRIFQARSGIRCSRLFLGLIVL